MLNFRLSFHVSSTNNINIGNRVRYIRVRFKVRVYICVWRYPVNFSVHYNIHYITFTILVRETWNDYIPNFTTSKVELKLMQL